MTTEAEELKPIWIDENTWMYAEPEGLCMVREVRDGERFVKTEVFNVPWSKIKKAIEVRKGLLTSGPLAAQK